MEFITEQCGALVIPQANQVISSDVLCKSYARIICILYRKLHVTIIILINVELTNFSFSSSISNLAAMQFLVSKKAFRCACSIKLCMKVPTRFTQMKTKIFAVSWNKNKHVKGQLPFELDEIREYLMKFTFRNEKLLT